MPRYVVERAFPEGLAIPGGSDGADARLAVVDRNGDEGVTWLNSYISEDKRKRNNISPREGNTSSTTTDARRAWLRSNVRSGD